MITRLRLAAATALMLVASPLNAQVPETPAKADATNALYCEERRLGYWFYCVKPAPEPAAPLPQAAAPVNASAELEAISSQFREHNASRVLDPCHVDQHIKKLEEYIEAFEREAKFTLSESNAITRITL